MRRALFLFAVAATPAFAQLPPEAASPAVTSARSYVFEYVITAAMFGLALYETVRPGNRNQS